MRLELFSYRTNTPIQDKLPPAHGQLKTQTADCRLGTNCRLGTKCRMQTADWVQNADCEEEQFSFFFLAKKITYVLITQSFRDSLISRISRFKTNREIKVTRTIIVANITWCDSHYVHNQERTSLLPLRPLKSLHITLLTFLINFQCKWLLVKIPTTLQVLKLLRLCFHLRAWCYIATWYKKRVLTHDQ